ncbi:MULTISPECIES: anti-sigma F factor antagonist [Clostridium]|jgi:stage II sporulation protein AA (anti-sigma F factor antagonist)|uniref:Anti-sigma F factor antagonist n=1 Tax=Clostridium sulfidigenes TaxID=318464 RepID=A0A084J927_9CLOT|nr:anti-sigma F factor antagonist [Clostridium sulfidigenes]KEZ85461.1 anti-anti-sigma factor [Clostridium sulfidigenes]MBE6060416.1 anti-sigma F factor antagonist [Clostridium sulfidigenes]HBL06583.1 anti-sigma F factor antagonist [Clostridium sp.]
MLLRFEPLDDKIVVTLQGELDHHSAEEVRTRIDDILDKDGYKALIFNFSGVNFMDSSGIGAVIGRYKKMSLRGGKVCLTNVTPTVKRIFELSGMFKIISMYENVEEALRNI